jgi:hypothetical protein
VVLPQASLRENPTGRTKVVGSAGRHPFQENPTGRTKVVGSAAGIPSGESYRRTYPKSKVKSQMRLHSLFLD